MADSDQDASTSEPSPAASQVEQARDRKSTLDKRVKLGFLVLAIVGAVLIYLHQRQDPQLGWPTATAPMLDKARADARPVVVFFMPHKPDGETRKMIALSLLHGMTQKQLKKLNYVTALVLDTKMTSSLAKRFKVEKLPTLVIISPKGEQYKENVTGFVGPAALKEMLGENAPQE